MWIDLLFYILLFLSSIYIIIVTIGVAGLITIVCVTLGLLFRDIMWKDDGKYHND